MVSITKRIGQGNTLEVTVVVQNRGTTTATRDVSLNLDGTTIDSESLSLPPGESTTVVLIDDTFGLPEVGTTRNYTTSTGGVEPDITTFIEGIFTVEGPPNVEIPSTDVGELQYEVNGELHFDAGDELNLITSDTETIQLTGAPATEVPSYKFSELRFEKGKLHIDQGDKLRFA